MVEIINPQNTVLLERVLERYRRALMQVDDYVIGPEWVTLMLDRFTRRQEHGLCYNDGSLARGFLTFKRGQSMVYVSMFFALRGKTRAMVLKALFGHLKEIFPGKTILVAETAPDISLKLQTALLEERGFARMDRLKMRLWGREARIGFNRPSGFVFRKYNTEFRHLLGDLDRRAYAGQPDEILLRAFADIGDTGPSSRLVDAKGLFESGLSAFAFHGEDLAGAVYCTKSGRKLGIANIAIDPAYQGQGLGKALLGQVIGGMERKGYQICELLVSKENSKAIVLYKKFGFKLKRICPIFVYPIGQGV
jgi:ribosomal protein S18 acetylase RimI-like enzyme